MVSLKESTDWFGTRWGWLVVWAITLVAVIAIVLVGVLFGLHPWSDVSPDELRSYSKEQCEKITTGGFLLQQANFWSNFAYLAAGLLIWMRNRTVIGTCTGIMFCFLALGSGYFHGTLTSSGKYLDIIGIYVVLTTLLLQGILESFDLHPPAPVTGGFFFLAWMMGVIPGVYKNDVELFSSDVWTIILAGALLAMMVIGALICNARWKSFGWPTVAAIGAFAIAIVFKYGDGKDNNSFPFSVFDGFLCKSFGSNPVFQGHAFWHVASAFGLFSVYEFFVSLRGKSESVWPWRD
jgi:hypothetical protein